MQLDEMTDETIRLIRTVARRAGKLNLDLREAPDPGPEAGTWCLWDSFGKYAAASAPGQSYGLSLDECLAWLDAEEAS